MPTLIIAEKPSVARGIADAVGAKLMVDMATQRYVNKINLTAQTPVITVNGANTGNTEADRKAMADVMALILQEQLAAGSAKSTARV